MYGQSEVSDDRTDSGYLMQFGIGLLGRGWKLEEQQEIMRHDDRPARSGFPFAASRYAAKLAADTILSEPATTPDLSREGLILALGGCTPPPRPSEFQMIRDAYTRMYPMGES